MKTNKLVDSPPDKRAEQLISNKGMLALNKALLSNQCYTVRKLKEDAFKRTINRAIYQMGFPTELSR
jgi:hypothetical protein